MTGRAWDAVTYHRVSAAMEPMARAVLDRLELRGDETVLDAGCGTGRVTALVVERLPHGRVIAIDASPDMVAQARANLGDRADVRQADLLELELDEEVDAVFSTATFHWVLDHDLLFANLHRALRPGGQLVAQCGGAGNISALLAAAAQVASEPGYAPHFEGWVRPSYYATAEATEERLHAAGFAEVRCWLEPHPVVPDEPHAYLATVGLGGHVQQLPEDLRPAFVDAVIARLPQPTTVDYIRLNLDARREA